MRETERWAFYAKGPIFNPIISVEIHGDVWVYVAGVYVEVAFLTGVLCGEAELNLLMTEAGHQERAVRLARVFTPAPAQDDPSQNATPGALGLPHPACLRRGGEQDRTCLGWPGLHWLILHGQKCV